ncbi:hypothetical protein V5E97_01040 [Singulisphaera sp. Ch08]|uniref:Uncharacterized protein n=1 Tax=Singulisphaera sp. Ch08 TaxID=3120278 RepID=A0AAU7CGM3_9BACT
MTMQGKRWLGLARVSLALIALFAGGCGQTGSTSDGDAQAVATQFLDELRAGRLEPAWQGTSVEFKSLMGAGSLRDYVKRHPALKANAEYSESRSIDRGGPALTECLFHATTRVRGKSVPATIKVILASGAEGWKVEQLIVE